MLTRRSQPLLSPGCSGGARARTGHRPDPSADDDTGRVFAGNRAAGRISLTVGAAAGKTSRTRVYEDGPLRVRFPGPKTSHLEAVIVNTAGGIAGGDHLALDLTVGAGADLVVNTAAAEKIYRSTGDDAELSLHLKLAEGAALAWLPQETILFHAARLSRSIEIELADDASILLAEG